MAINPTSFSNAFFAVVDSHAGAAVDVEIPDKTIILARPSGFVVDTPRFAQSVQVGDCELLASLTEKV
jgi:hypothetical protein